MAGLKRTYRIVDGNGRIYLPKSVREEAGMHPGDIIRLEADKSGWIGLMKVELIEAGDQSPEATEAYVRAAVRQMPDKSRVSLAYMADRDGIVKLRMPFDEEQLEALMDQETLPELIVFLDSHVTPVLVVRGGNIQFCTDDGLGEKLERLLRKRRNGKERGDGRHCG